MNQKLTSVNYDSYGPNIEESEDELMKDSTAYQKLVGRLLFLIMTRPDIAYVVQVLSKFMHSLKRSHLDVALRVVRYIKGTPRLGLFMPARRTNQLHAYCDSYWGACLETRGL